MTSKLRKPYRMVFQYPDNGYPNANAIWQDEPTTRRLARIKATYYKRLQHTNPDHEKGTIWIERQLTDGTWRRLDDAAT